MKLAKEFKFVTKGAQNIFYTAKNLNDTNVWRVTRDQGYAGGADHSEEDVRSYIIDGLWIVREVIVPSEQDEQSLEVGDDLIIAPPLFGVVRKQELKYVGRTIFSLLNKPYKMKLHPSSDDRYIPVGEQGAEFDYEYTEERIEKNLTENGWRLLEEPAPEFVEPEFLPPDDIPSLIDSAETFVQGECNLAQIRAWTKELGVVVEVCEDFYTVKKDGYSFVAETACDLVSIIGAFRTLNKAVDKG